MRITSSNPTNHRLCYYYANYLLHLYAFFFHDCMVIFLRAVACMLTCQELPSTARGREKDRDHAFICKWVYVFFFVATSSVDWQMSSLFRGVTLLATLFS